MYSVISVTFGYRKMEDVTIWPVNAGVRYVIDAEEFMDNVNAINKITLKILERLWIIMPNLLKIENYNN